MPHKVKAEKCRNVIIALQSHSRPPERQVLEQRQAVAGSAASYRRPTTTRNW